MGLLFSRITQPLNAQEMRKIEVKKLSIKEVKILIETKHPVLNTEISDKLFAKVYIFGSGEVLLVNDNGKGGLWKSLDDFNNFGRLDNQTQAQLNVLNLEGWLNERSEIEPLLEKAIILLSSILGKELDYSEQSLNAVNKIKIKNVLAQKDTLYAILLYSCGYFSHNYGGKFEIGLRENGVFEPCILGEKGRRFIPYAEYMNSMSEPLKVSLMESIELERKKYNLYAD